MGEPAEAIRHERHYTREEANAERAWVAEQVEMVRDAIEVLAEDEAQDALDSIDPDSGGGYPGFEVASAVMQLLGGLSELEAKDVVLRDAERGLVDFPTLRDGREVYLCWLVDEPEVAWWHDHDSGFDGRMPLD